MDHLERGALAFKRFKQGVLATPGDEKKSAKIRRKEDLWFIIVEYAETKKHKYSFLYLKKHLHLSRRQAFTLYSRGSSVYSYAQLRKFADALGIPR